ncbi:uncharacterized protein L969DRAFT_342336 [Mixia osmundae IAM 14324]|uniref:MIF4G domain-containing protein n=1 Tax=Mixia osmundae (strain CBS 9802 / IAM 14324 / JCM 22182 / KY 12970) TaxID=764103 RepID=G7E5Z1_MIXOS|nr:uncharacterized protein L969DRAFT_342336 [Mixia osmundae IAM 14324]KEI40599.1 hypothetical protein L969DRAFT_342336 [Mixia osmundae IAM 14324]GAA98251.1 hypothetical protein E5Q_04934 [Mixia osmundae IAM 14324]
MAQEGPGGSSKNARRVVLRQNNLVAWEQADTVSSGRALDASLKKNTGYIKRLRSSLNAADSVAVLLKETSTLSLEKYLSEIVGAAVEGVGRCKTAVEIQGGVEVISALHCRFPTLFTRPFKSQLLASLQPCPKDTSQPVDQREREEASRVIRQRSLLRVLGELEYVGVIRPDKAGQVGDVLFAAFRDLLTADKDALVASIPLAVSFAKHLSPLYLSTAPEEDAGSVVQPAEKAKFRQLLSAYYDALSKRSVKEHTHLLQTDQRNHDAYIRSGEIFEDRAQVYEKLSRNWEKLWAGVQSLSETLALPLPTLPPLPSAVIPGGSLISDGTARTEGVYETSGSVWLDEEEKRFYVDLLDLSLEVPASLLGVAKEDTKPDTTTLPDIDAPVRSDDLTEEELQKDYVEPSLGTADEPLPAGPSAQLTALLARLPEMSSVETIDRAAVEFAGLNSKAARNRLVKALFSFNRKRLDLIPFYSRLVATLNVYMPDVGANLLSLLDDEFRYLAKRKNIELTEMRLKTLRYISELTKFGVTPLHSILHYYKVCLDDFARHNIDNICILLESCGRYLLRSEDSRERFKPLLDVFKRKKSVQNLDQRQIAMLDSAYYQCDPPERAAIEHKQRSDMELFIRYLMYNLLGRHTLEKVLKLLRKLDWNDELVHRKIFNTFTKIWKVKFSQISLVAVLLYDMSKFHAEFTISVIDQVLENFRLGLDQNSFKQNQQRIATVKYLGELYVYRVVDSRVIFDVLWSLVTFGHPEGRPWPDYNSPTDPQDDYFRIRLVATLLDSVGPFFDKGGLKVKLDGFMTFFELYLFCKKPLPIEVEFLVSDLFEKLRPASARATSYAEAALALDELVAQASDQLDLPRAGDELDRRESDSSSSTSSSSSDETIEDIDLSDDEDDDATPIALSDDEEDINARPRHVGMSAEEEDAFSQELAKMMVSNSEKTRQIPKTTLADIVLPVRKREASGSMAPLPVEQDHMSFTLLSKKGNKAQARTMQIPLASTIAVNSMTKQAQDVAEKQELKRLVLNYEHQSEADTKSSPIRQHRQRPT